MKKNYIYLIAILIFSTSYCQNSSDENKAKIASVFENYFNLERETIHLHLNKTIFLNNETIWFKGYAINRKNSKPFFTTNVFLLLLDEKGNQISEQLIYANNGNFSGKIELENNMNSGNYYIQAYTNWMNNFSEDESTISKIAIINPSEGLKNYKKVNPEALQITINPEGGNYIRDTENTIGISFLDCRNNTVNEIEGQLKTLDDKILRTFKLNLFGHGTITIPPTDEKLKITFEVNGEKIEKELPLLQEFGIALSVNNYSNEQKTFINLNTNSATLKKLSDKKLFLVINKDEKLIIQEFSFQNQTQKRFTIESNKLFKGVNTVRIIDSELNQICERLIYSDSINKSLETPISIIKNKIDQGQINFVGYNNLPNSNVSLSLLPELSKSNDYSKTNINVGININPYLTNSLENAAYYFEKRNRLKKMDLDLALLNQSTLKYNWNNMKMNVPKSNYSFDIGLNLAGKIEENIKDKDMHKVRLLSHIDFINKISDVDKTGQYTIENFIIVDSTSLDLSLLKLPSLERIKYQLNPKVSNRNRPFYKIFKNKWDKNCDVFEYETVSFEYPKLSSNMIELDEVEIENKLKKPKLVFKNEFGNLNFRGFKIDETYTMTLLHFIASNGFRVDRTGGQVTITNRQSASSFTDRGVTVEVTIDGRRLFSLNELDYTQMSEIDEIYLNPNAMITGIRGRLVSGEIKIYMKKNTGKEVKSNTFNFMIEKGFSQPVEFKGEKYTNTAEKGFENFGVIGWCPNIISDKDGLFTFEILNLNQQKGIIDIEGIDPNGNIIQQQMIMSLN
ncbi:hypothetical protein [Flavobacterium soli]|uniref:hypothetical protein n=1 Tax=Flavobacterium soli TaxID=344881 RepID=UPI0003F9F4C5|nr:hypothetical protein [Flavobacterium soli]